MKTNKFVRSFLCRTLTWLLIGIMPILFLHSAAAAPAPAAPDFIIYSAHGQVPPTKAEYAAMMAQLRNPKPFFVEDPHQEVLGWCLAIGGGVAAAAAIGYGLWVVCYNGNLTTNCPPFYPPHPPRTNTPASSSQSMQIEGKSSVTNLTVGTNMLFQQTTAMEAQAICEPIGYVDPDGQPYIRCARTTLQSRPSTSGPWTSELVSYQWRNSNFVCSVICSLDGKVLESAVTSNSFPIPTFFRMETFDRKLVIDTTIFPGKQFRLSALAP